MLEAFASEQLNGVRAKLERADESILNLSNDIAAFLNQFGTDGSVTHEDYERFKKWINTHTHRDIPDRFGLLAGEIVHHFRSCLDHIAWGFSSNSYREDHPTLIAFPIQTSSPTKKERSRYERQVEGITSQIAKALIEKLQPYHTGEPLNDPLAIIHQLDRIDKHQTLVVILPSFTRSVSIPFSEIVFTQRAIGMMSDEDEKLVIQKPAFKAEIKYSRQVAFAHFGERKNEPIVPSLTNLADAVKGIVRQFSEL